MNNKAKKIKLTSMQLKTTMRSDESIILEDNAGKKTLTFKYFNIRFLK